MRYVRRGDPVAPVVEEKLFEQLTRQFKGGHGIQVRHIGRNLSVHLAMPRRTFLEETQPIRPGTLHVCSKYFLYVWNDLNLAALMDPLFGWYQDGGKIWTAETEGSEPDNKLHKRMGKEGWTRARVMFETELPPVTTAMRVRFAIYVADQIVGAAPGEMWNTWKTNWLDATDRTAETIEAQLNRPADNTLHRHALRCALAYLRGYHALAAEYAAEIGLRAVLPVSPNLADLAAQAIADE